MTKYLDDALGAVKTPQSEPIPGSTQVANNAGGYAWSVDDKTRMRRFLILGSEGGTMYQKERELTRENIAASLRVLDEDGPWFVSTLVDVSLKGAAAKQDPTLFLLAAACAAKDLETRKAAFNAIKLVCRTGTHIFTFCRYVEQFRGWGRGLRSAVSEWYFRDAVDLALQAVKYRQRDGWTHRDVLRLTHPKTSDIRLENVWRFMLGAELEPGTSREVFIDGFQRAMASKRPEETANLIREYQLPREAVLSDHLTHPVVWEALLTAGQGMPYGAMVRNLGNMGKAGIIGPMSACGAFVVQRLRDESLISRSRIHPMQLLAALLTYGQGNGMRGSGEWPVNGQIMDGLNDAFHLSFGNVQPSGKSTMLCVDTSGSMWSGNVGGIPGLTPLLAASAMCLVTASVESRYGIFGFTTSLQALAVSKGQRLDDVFRYMQENSYNGGTDCARPMIAATNEGLEVETFVIYTDNETWAGSMHPKQALDEYRAKGPGNALEARVAVVAMTSSGFSIADPNDAGMMDLVGFDTGTPEVLRQFAIGAI